jgi:hypothetical protein
MIPPFNENGYLPPGVHVATLEEIEARFGIASELRRAQIESLRWLVDLARRVQATRLIVNGSFVTDVYEPNDVDCLLLVEKAVVPKDGNTQGELLAGLPFIAIDLVEQDGFNMMVERVFATDRLSVPKGMIEVVSWR